jgi:hypothetical protein
MAADVSKWRVAQINTTERPFAIIRSDGRFGDELVAHSLSERTARLLCGPGGIRWAANTAWHWE